MDESNLSWKERCHGTGVKPGVKPGAYLMVALVVAALFALVFGMVACATVPLTPVQPIPWGVHTCTPGGQVWIDGPGVPAAYATPAIADATGAVSYSAVPRSVTAFNFHLKHDGQEYGQVVTIPAGGASVSLFVGDCDIPARAVLVPAYQVGNPSWIFTPLPRIARDGKFISVGGQPYFGLGASSYALDLLYQTDRAAFTAVVAELHDLGFNEVRVWTLADVDFSEPRGGHLRIIPSELPDFYTQTRQMVRELARSGIYVELTAFTGTARLMPNLSDQQAHLDALVAIARSETNVLIEVGNEYDQGDNQWEAWKLRYPDDILISAGSVGADNWPSEYGLPDLQYQLYHSNDAPQWWRKMPHEPWELGAFYKMPARANENTKADDAAAGADGSLAGPRIYGAFQGCKLLNDGCAFHFRDGRMSRLMTPDIKALAQQAVAGANSIEARCRRIDQYVHRDDLEGPGQSKWLRVYQQGNDAACLAFVPN